MTNKYSPGLRIIIAWFFIIATVAFTQIPVYRAAKAPPTNATQDIRLQLMGKYVVGMKLFLGNSPTLKNRLEPLKQALQKNSNANTPLLVVPIMAEISGKDAAIVELKRLMANPANDGVTRDAPLFLQLYQNGGSSLDSRQRLAINRFGWFGQLALSQDKSATDPERKEILKSALRTVVVMMAFTIGCMGAIAAGLILFTVAIVLRVKGRLCGRLTIPESAGNLLVETFAIYLTGFVALPAFSRWLFPDFRLGASALGILAVIFAILWPRFCGLDWKTYRTALGWNLGQGFFREVGAGILGYIAGLPILMIAAVLVGILSRYTGIMPVHPIVFEITRGPLYLLFWGILACVWAPVVEETFFRGALFGYFRRHIPWAVSGILVGLLFAIIHPQGLVAVPLLAAIGFNFCAIREWRGSIIASMSAHALNNGSVLLLLFLALA